MGILDLLAQRDYKDTLEQLVMLYLGHMDPLETQGLMDLVVPRGFQEFLDHLDYLDQWVYLVQRDYMDLLEQQVLLDHLDQLCKNHLVNLLDLFLL